MSNAVREAEQDAWTDKLAEIRKEFGYWNFTDNYSSKNNGQVASPRQVRDTIFDEYE